MMHFIFFFMNSTVLGIFQYLRKNQWESAFFKVRFHFFEKAPNLSFYRNQMHALKSALLPLSSGVKIVKIHP